MLDLSRQPVRAYPKSKQLYKKRIKPTQKQMGAISPSVRKQVRERSGGICELRIKCNGLPAVQQAHKRGRRRMEHKTTAEDLWDVCVYCHTWLDSTGEGAIFKRKEREK